MVIKPEVIMYIPALMWLGGAESFVNSLTSQSKQTVEMQCRDLMSKDGKGLSSQLVSRKGHCFNL